METSAITSLLCGSIIKGSKVQRVSLLNNTEAPTSKSAFQLMMEAWLDIVDRDIQHYDVFIMPKVPSKAVIKDKMCQYLDFHLGECIPVYDGERDFMQPCNSLFHLKTLDELTDSIRREHKFNGACLKHLEWLLRRWCQISWDLSLF